MVRSHPVAPVSHGQLAQLVEHLVYTERVTGSSPVLPTHMPLRQTSILEKLAPSIINSAIALILGSLLWKFSAQKIPFKLSVIFIFFIYNFYFLFFTKSSRDIGMIIFSTKWTKPHSPIQKTIYTLLYTLSFSSLLYWVYFPFDLFLFNMLLVQLPCILISDTTFHGLLSGKIATTHYAYH